jgi:hypothetical protein
VLHFGQKRLGTEISEWHCEHTIDGVGIVGTAVDGGGGGGVSVFFGYDAGASPRIEGALAHCRGVLLELGGFGAAEGGVSTSRSIVVALWSGFPHRGQNWFVEDTTLRHCQQTSVSGGGIGGASGGAGGGAELAWAAGGEAKQSAPRRGGAVGDWTVSGVQGLGSVARSAGRKASMDGPAYGGVGSGPAITATGGADGASTWGKALGGARCARSANHTGAVGIW